MNKIFFRGRRDGYYPFDIVAGETERNSPASAKSRQAVKPNDIVFHPEWDSVPVKSVEGDLALVQVIHFLEIAFVK